MKHNKKTKLIIIFIALSLAFVGLGFIINACFFQKITTIVTTGHYEPQVYITPSGNCYHNDSCSYITSISPIGLYQAQSRGFTACLHCDGLPCGSIWIKETKHSDYSNNYLLSFSISFVLIYSVAYVLLKKVTKQV